MIKFVKLKVFHRKTEIDVSDPAVIVRPDVPERVKDFLKTSDEVYGYRKLASATGGVYKGQGRNQRELMTRAY